MGTAEVVVLVLLVVGLGEGQGVVVGLLMVLFRSTVAIRPLLTIIRMPNQLNGSRDSLSKIIPKRAENTIPKYCKLAATIVEPWL